jgi:hypothetical protein
MPWPVHIAVQRRTASATSGSVAMACTWDCHRSMNRRARSPASGGVSDLSAGSVMSCGPVMAAKYLTRAARGQARGKPCRRVDLSRRHTGQGREIERIPDIVVAKHKRPAHSQKKR